MKNLTEKRSTKKDREVFAAEIENNTINHVTELLESYNLESKKAKKIIIKSSKKLGKKLAKEFKDQISQKHQTDLEEALMGEQESLIPETLHSTR